MSLVKYGGGVIQMSGSIAGNTFARNRFGNYVRARTKPINPKSASQNDVRESLSQLVARWASHLSAAERTAWNLYAASVAMKNKLGETVYLTGMNHFVRSNAWLELKGLTVIDPGPTNFTLPGQDPVFAVTASIATQQMTCVYDPTLSWAAEAGGYLLLYLGQPQNPQRNFFDGPWKYMNYVAGVVGAPPASPKVSAVPFVIALGQHLFAYARILRADGRLSEVFRASCFCGA